MQKNKLILSLKLLDSYQFRQFRDYVYSPFFNKNSKIIALFDFIHQYYPSFEHKNLKQHYVLKTLQLKTAQQLYTLSSRLLELLNNFLTYTLQQEDKLHQKLCTIKALRQQQADQQLQTAIRQHQLLQQHSPYKNAKNHYEKYLFYDELDQIFLAKPRRVYDENLQLKSDHLDISYLITKLKLACDMTSRNIVIKANYTCGLLPSIKAVIAQTPSLLAAHAGIGIYYQILKMLENGKKEDYQLLKTLLVQHITDFPKEEMLLMYDYAQNYCIRQINTGKSTYYSEFLNLYKAQLQHGILFKNGFLEEWDYKNIITAGIRIEDYEWTEQFIRQMRNRLKPNVRENAHAYNLAAIYYATQRYKAALQQLQTIEFTDSSYHLGAKIIQLKSYYELDEFEAFQSLIQSFRLYVQRSKQISEYRRKANLNMLKLAKKIGKFREQQDYISAKKIEQEILKINKMFELLSPLANVDWLQSIWVALSKYER